MIIVKLKRKPKPGRGKNKRYYETFKLPDMEHLRQFLEEYETRLSTREYTVISILFLGERKGA